MTKMRDQNLIDCIKNWEGSLIILKLSKERPWHSDSAHEHKCISSLGFNFHFDYFSAMHALEKFLNFSEPVFS